MDGIMSWRMRDFLCPFCDNEFESLVADTEETHYCSNCGETAEKIMSAPRIGLYENNPELKAKVLKKRSADHTAKEVAREHEKFGFKAAKSERWNLRNKK